MENKKNKKYSKPEIIIEDFSIAQNIAYCGALHEKNPWGFPTQGNIDDCGWSDGKDTLWIGAPNCTEATNKDANVGGVCYNNPVNGLNIFSS